jgi:hypothetical protein
MTPEKVAIEVHPAAEVPDKKGIVFDPDVKGPDDPDNKANAEKTGQEKAVDAFYEKHPQEKDELSNENDHPLKDKPNTDY